MVLGRLATEVARIIRGKHKPIFTPHMDTGDGVIVINASKVRVTGRKAEQKEYFHHTGYMGHERFTPFASMLAKHPERVIEKAVYGMLPKTALGRQVAPRQAPRLRGRRAPARRAAAQDADLPEERGEVRHGLIRRSRTRSAAARKRSAACTSSPAAASGTSTAARSVITSRVPRS